jgi:HAD superfamily hydrolase (TIGR01549 family)
MTECVIFDVDGTLVDSVDLHAKTWQEALAEFGKTVSFEEVRTQIGKGGDQLLPVFLTPQEMDRLEKAISSWRSERFQKLYLPKVVGFANVRALFQRILADGKKIALASSARGDELETYKVRAQISDLVDTETSKDDAAKSKPHPDIFKAALERLGNPSPEKVIVVGDTPYDIEAAAKLGVKTIAVRCGGFSEATLAGAISIYDNPTDLLSHYDRSPLGNHWAWPG